MWFYNTKLNVWFHAMGVRSNNPPDRKPTDEETRALLEAVPSEDYAHAMADPPARSGGCGCAGKEIDDLRRRT